MGGREGYKFLTEGSSCRKNRDGSKRSLLAQDQATGSRTQNIKFLERPFPSLWAGFSAESLRQRKLDCLKGVAKMTTTRSEAVQPVGGRNLMWTSKNRVSDGHNMRDPQKELRKPPKVVPHRSGKRRIGI